MNGESLLDRSSSADAAMDDAAPGHRHHHPLSVFLRDARLAFRWDELGREIMGIAVPGALALMADPVASLVDTAFIGHIGPVELAAVGVSIAVFNQVSRIAIFPLVSVTTSFVAEEDATSSDREKYEINGENEFNVSDSEMEELVSHEEASAAPNKSSFETDSSDVKIEHKRKNIPSVSTALLLGGVLGLLQALLLVICAKPLLGYMGVKQYGVSGAAIAHVISQYFIASILLWRLRLHVDLLPPSFKHRQFSRFLKNGFLLLARVIAATCCVTLSASMAARLGPVPMAAFQICLQIWLASSLLADGLAFAGQAILASAFARQDHSKAAATASRILQLGLVLGLLLSIFLGIGLRLGSRLFTDDQDVLHHIYLGIPILVAIVSIIFIVTLASYNGFVGIWIALTVYMSLRMLAGFLRIGTARGPWTFLCSSTHAFS
uniref:Protein DETOXIFICATION n=1 Tax=Oryza meridionalis TaxID=40149 RepID=A0A0E0EWH8_9ORYZ